MRLFLIVIAIFFFCFLAGSDTHATQETSGDYSESVGYLVQADRKVTVGLDSPEWLKTYLFIRDVLSSGKQLDLPGDYQKNWNNLHGRILHFIQNGVLTIQQRICCTLEYLRLLAVRYGEGFYIYSLEKLLI